jgi:hypothetical protein
MGWRLLFGAQNLIASSVPTHHRLAKAEVCTHLPGGGKQMQTILHNAGVTPIPLFAYRRTN